MSGLCGWVSHARELGGADQCLERMSAALPQYDVVLSEQHCGAFHGLAQRSQANLGHWAEDGGLLVALEGDPAWRSDKLARLAAARGHAFAAAAAYKERAEGMLDELHGGFALAVVDTSARSAFLAIDRYGIQPLCYATGNKGELVFGSTVDAVRRHPGVETTLRLQSLYDYFYFIDRVPAPATIYEEQHKLIPGQYLSYADGRCRLETYWQMPYVEDSGKGFDELAEEVPRLLRRSVAGALEGEDPSRVAAFLSGGLDSSTVCGLLAEMSPEKARCFTIGFAMDGFDETEYAAIAAKHFDMEHNVYYVTAQDELDALPKVAEIYDEPFANSSAIAAYFCALRAREAGIDLMLAGDGGDELFAGNSRYLSDGVFDHYQKVPALVRRGLIEPIVAAPWGDSPPALIRKARNYQRYASMSVAQRMTYHNVYSKIDASEMFTPESMAQIDRQAPLALADEIFFSSKAASKLQRMMNFDLRITLADSDLRKVSRTCELAGVRVKYPFLEDELVACTATIPSKLFNQGDELRALYKRVFAGFLPQEVLRKEKQGFGIPCLEFVDAHGPLRDFTADCLGALKPLRIFQDSFLGELIDRVHKSESDCHNGVTWDLMALSLWFQSRSPAR